MNPVTSYVNEISSMYGSGVATEHSYRSTLEGLLKAFDESVQVINEPRHLAFGAPDMVLQLAGQPVGYVECKDVRVALDAVENSPQLKRYRNACDNLILTNYREFRWYRGGELSETVVVARLTGSGLSPQRQHYNAAKSLLARFQRAAPTEINTPEELAQVMADLTREIKDLIIETLGTDHLTFLHRHWHDLESELLPTLDNAEFADMYAQTLAYALFAARILHRGPSADFTLERAFFRLPATNPFLKREFQDIVQDLDHEVQWAVEQLVLRLAHTQVDEVFEGFRRQTGQHEDPAIHFYEDFLAAYNPRQRERRGVYFTPAPVVDYIVRSVDSLLRSHFGRRDGLASDGVHILDPAAGTGSFLARVIKRIHEILQQSGQVGIWPDYVRRQLVPRLHGFELLMAPYTLAHMRLGLLLEETGFRLRDDERFSIYLVNSLDRGERREERLAGEFRNHIEIEADSAAAVKNDTPIMVVLGNPPYSGTTANRGKWINDLLNDYRKVDGVSINERGRGWLVDDYVKFIRFGQWRIERNGEGVLAFITNHGWLDNPTFRGMRQSLLNSFSEIYVLNLHGNSKKKETTPEGNKDENVFDIQQGVSIAFFIKRKGHSGPARVFHSDLWGLRRDKYAALNAGDIESTDWQEIVPQSPFYLFKPFDYDGWRDYAQGWKLTDIFPAHSTGMVTGRDKFVLDFDYDVLRERFEKIRERKIHSDEIRHLVEGYELKDKPHWQLDPMSGGAL